MKGLLLVLSKRLSETGKSEEMGAEKLNIMGLIPARAGSVGVPGKNRRLICGRPVIAYTIDAAMESELLSSIVVSSDDTEVLEYCKDIDGVAAIERPAELSGSTSRIDDAVRHAVEVMEAVGDRIDYIVLLYANIPVRPEGVVDQAIKLMLESGSDSVLSVSDVGKFHPYWLFQMDESQGIKKYIPNNIFRRQDLPPLYSIDGAVSVLKRDVVMNSAGSENPHAFWGDRIQGMPLHSHETIDIDSMRDFLLAESVLTEKTLRD